MTETLPHNLDAERAVLGGVIVNNELFLEIADALAPDDFFRVPHQHVYAAIRELALARTPIDEITLRARLAARGQLDDVGPAYLFGLTDGVPHSANVPYYAALVRDQADKRRLMAAARKILSDVQSEDRPARDLVNDAEREIFAIAERGARRDFIHAEDLVARNYQALGELIESKKGVTGVSTGFRDLDDITLGLQPGDLVIVAARPSMGKTALVLNMAFNVARTNLTVGLFSIEMSEQQLFMRLVSSVGGINGHRLQAGYLSQQEYSNLGHTFGEIGASGLCIDDSADLGVLDVMGKARRLKARKGLALIIIDYLQLMHLNPRAENRNLAIGEVSRGLKMVAKELQVPLVVLSQLSREVERRGDKRPLLSDLRDSGSLEQDADVVLFIHRPEVYKKGEDPGLAEIIVAKHRNGPIGMVKLFFDKASTRFDNWSNRSDS